VTSKENYSSVQHDFNIIWCSCCLAVTPVYHGCYKLSRNCKPFRSTWVHLRFSGVRVDRSVVFCVVFCRSVFVLVWSVYCPLFFWPLYCLSFFHFQLLTYPFGIFNLFLFPTHYICSNIFLCCLIYLFKNEYMHLVLDFLFFNKNVKG